MVESKEAMLERETLRAKEKAIRDKFEAQKKADDMRNREKDKVHPAGNTHTSPTRENHPPRIITVKVADSPLYTKAKIPHSLSVSAHR